MPLTVQYVMNSHVMLNTDDVIPVKEIEDLESLRIVTDSQRHHILCLLTDEALTPTNLARRLKINRTRVYYHLDLLMKHGMIRVVSERQVVAIVERTYRAVAKAFRVNRGLLAASASNEEISRVQTEILEHAADDARSATDPNILISRSFIQLTFDDARELRAEMLALINKFQERSKKNAETFEIAMALFNTKGIAI